MYTTIVTGTDGSPSASAALERAIGLAKQCGATLHVVTAYRPASVAGLGDTEMSLPGSADLLKEVAASADAEVQALLGRCVDAAKAEGVKAVTHATGGDAADALVTTAEDNGADLIVLGNRGMSGTKRFLLGSVPNKVSHHAPCDVLIVSTT